MARPKADTHGLPIASRFALSRSRQQVLFDFSNLGSQYSVRHYIRLRKSPDHQIKAVAVRNQYCPTQLSQSPSELIPSDNRVTVLPHNYSHTTIRKKGSDRPSLEMLGTKALP